MRTSPNLQWVMQVALFHPALSDPHWEQQPWEVRQQTVRLLARMLSEHWARTLACETTTEARDE